MSVRLPKVRDYQRPVYESGARFKDVMCGRRWGKTKLGVACAIAGHGPARHYFPGAGGKARIGWIVPSEEHPAAAEAWADLKKAVATVPHVVSEERKRIELLAGGGSVQLW